MMPFAETVHFPSSVGLKRDSIVLKSIGIELPVDFDCKVKFTDKKSTQRSPERRDITGKKEQIFSCFQDSSSFA
jgi:hypothetical protein